MKLFFPVFQKILNAAIQNITNFCQKVQIHHFYIFSFVIAIHYLIFYACQGMQPMTGNAFFLKNFRQLHFHFSIFTKKYRYR